MKQTKTVKHGNSRRQPKPQKSVLRRLARVQNPLKQSELKPMRSPKTRRPELSPIAERVKNASATMANKSRRPTIRRASKTA